MESGQEEKETQNNQEREAQENLAKLLCLLFPWSSVTLGPW